MPVLHSHSDDLEIIYHRDYRILIGRFLRPQTEAGNHQCYLDLLAAARVRHDCRYWLLDIRRRDRSGPEVLAWLRRDFYPQLLQKLGAPMRLVYFMAPGLLAEFQTDNSMPAPEAFAPGAPFRIHQAITEGDAVRWLLDEQVAEGSRQPPGGPGA